MKLDWKVKTFSQLTVRELYEIYKARENVFVVEQQCPYHEIDQNDLTSLHVYAIDDHMEVIAYARIFREGEHVTFGRVLVRHSWRGNGLGRQLVAKILSTIKETIPGKSIVIEAQEYIQPLYSHFGFRRASDNYLIDNIPHVKMVYDH
ncbi:GNAT family N-acetyltransferase [Sporolactobacillus sp. THM7-4]|nr:GNAT family N-acetyltransferase [Sporolactobacillus sp. THM7-4]